MLGFELGGGGGAAFEFRVEGLFCGSWPGARVVCPVQSEVREIARAVLPSSQTYHRMVFHRFICYAARIASCSRATT